MSVEDYIINQLNRIPFGWHQLHIN